MTYCEVSQLVGDFELLCILPRSLDQPLCLWVLCLEYSFFYLINYLLIFAFLPCYPLFISNMSSAVTHILWETLSAPPPHRLRHPCCGTLLLISALVWTTKCCHCLLNRVPAFSKLGSGERGFTSAKPRVRIRTLSTNSLEEWRGLCSVSNLTLVSWPRIADPLFPV